MYKYIRSFHVYEARSLFITGSLHLHLTHQKDVKRAIKSLPSLRFIFDCRPPHKTSHHRRTQIRLSKTPTAHCRSCRRAPTLYVPCFGCPSRPWLILWLSYSHGFKYATMTPLQPSTKHCAVYTLGLLLLLYIIHWIRAIRCFRYTAYVLIDFLYYTLSSTK